MDYTNNSNEPSHHFPFKKASVGRRLGAFLIDHFIFSFVFVFLFVFVLLLFGIQNRESLVLIFVIFNFVIIFLVYGFRDVIKGQSIGKRVFGIGVRDISDNFAVPSVSRLFLRQIFSFIWPIEFLVLIFSSENRKIGDQIAGTGVYNLREYEDFVLYTKRMEYISQTQGIETQNGVTEPRVVEPYKPQKAKIAKIVIGVILAVVRTCSHRRLSKVCK